MITHSSQQLSSPDEHVSERGEVTVLYVVNLSHTPGICPPSHLLIVHLNHSVATHHRKGDGLLGEGERKEAGGEGGGEGEGEGEGQGGGGGGEGGGREKGMEKRGVSKVGCGITSGYSIYIPLASC